MIDTVKISSAPSVSSGSDKSRGVPLVMMALFAGQRMV
jgi:hypothetical protein